MDFLDITVFGAVGDGKTDNSSAFEKAFSTENVSIRIPEGIWLTGPVTLKSGSTIYINEGATVKFIDKEELYTPVYSRWEGVRCYCMHPLIYSENSHDVKVCGKGSIDGSGLWWWSETRAKKNRAAVPETDLEKQLASLNPEHKQQPGGGGGRGTQFLRPPMVQFNRCNKVTLEGVRLFNSPFWTVHPVFSTNVVIDGISINNPADSPNTDAIDIDSCKCVTIKNCNISVGDDGIAVKSGAGPDGVAAAFSTEDVNVFNCTVKSAHGGAVVGSETAGSVRRVSFSDCKFIGTDRGVRMKTRRGRGGTIEDISFKNIEIDGCLCPVTMNMYYKCGTTESWPFSLEKLEVNDVTPHVRNITIENVNAKNIRSSAGFFVGLPESKITNLSVENCTFELGKDLEDTDLSEMFIGPAHTESRGIRILNADVVLKNVKVLPLSEKMVYNG